MHMLARTMSSLIRLAWFLPCLVAACSRSRNRRFTTSRAKGGNGPLVLSCARAASHNATSASWRTSSGSMPGMRHSVAMASAIVRFFVHKAGTLTTAPVTRRIPQQRGTKALRPGRSSDGKYPGCHSSTHPRNAHAARASMSTAYGNRITGHRPGRLGRRRACDVRR